MTQLNTRVPAGVVTAASPVKSDPYTPRLTVTALADIRRFEQTPLSDRRLPDSTYELLRLARDRAPEAPALHYFTSGDELGKAVTITHAQMFTRITQTANLLHSLGLGPDDVIGVLMPVTPESQYAIWGSEAAGIACPVNWMLEPEIIAALLRNAGAKAVIAYGPDVDIEAWNKAMLVRRELPGVQYWIRPAAARQVKRASSISTQSWLASMATRLTASASSRRKTRRPCSIPAAPPARPSLRCIPTATK